MESAQQIMESDLRYQFNLDSEPLRLDYSYAAQPAAAVSASASSDWICPGCSAVNFSRWVRKHTPFLFPLLIVVFVLEVLSRGPTDKGPLCASILTRYCSRY